jgi:NAD(P)-dependent dehydrogenase (short-subunit alcohol dehydrogenase family)
MRAVSSVALVVGGGSGLGAAAARRLSRDGWQTVIADLAEGRARSVAASVAGAHAVAVDVTADASVGEAVEAAAALGELRAVVCSAGIGWAERLVGKRGLHEQSSWDRVIAINLSGSFAVLRHSARAMAENSPDADGSRGVCVLTSSIAAQDGQAGSIAYASAKAGVAGMVLPAARDLARLGVRVNAVLPGTFETPLLAGLPENARRVLAESVPFPSRLGRPEEYASLVAEIVANSMINGALIRIDGALRMPHV